MPVGPELVSVGGINSSVKVGLAIKPIGVCVYVAEGGSSVPGRTVSVL